MVLTMVLRVQLLLTMALMMGRLAPLVPVVVLTVLVMDLLAA